MSKLTQAWRQGVTPRAHIWAEVPDEKWNDWHWQLSHRVNDLAVLEAFLDLTDEEIEGICADDKFRPDTSGHQGQTSWQNRA